jgi:hypothetical protein
MMPPLLVSFLALATTVAAVEPLPNANHIFNVLTSATRQWGSSLNHNGVSFFLATVPAGTLLHHGRGHADEIVGPEWLAFEPEHAANFAVQVRDGDGNHIPLPGAPPNASVKWHWPMIVSSEQLHSQPRSMAHKDHQQSVLRHQFHLPVRNYTMYPGYLHTLVPKRDLHLVYIDGMSAGKSTIGTLDSQDRVLLRRMRSPDARLWDDFGRAQDLCRMAKEQHGGRVDGFMRMEHGFEVILCDFSIMETVDVLKHEVKSEIFDFFVAVTNRYPGLGHDRVWLNSNTFVTAFEYPELNIFENSTDGALPNITLIGTEWADRLSADLEDLALTDDFPCASDFVVGAFNLDRHDWQAVADQYVLRFAKRIQALQSSPHIDEPGLLANTTASMLAVHINGTLSPAELTEAVDRCTYFFIPQPLIDRPLSEQPLAQRAITTVTTRVCSTLLSIAMEPSDDIDAQRGRLRDLQEWLQWPVWKYCDDGRGCGIDALCFTSIWPWGTQEDHDHPRCLNRGNFLESVFNSTGMGSYWSRGWDGRR